MTIDEQAIACDLGALSEDELSQHERIGERMKNDLLEVKELPDGYAFRYPAGRTMIEDLARFIASERLCCPFFTFNLRLAPDGELWISLVGSEEVKRYARETLRPFLGGETDEMPL